MCNYFKSVLSVSDHGHTRPTNIRHVHIQNMGLSNKETKKNYNDMKRPLFMDVQIILCACTLSIPHTHLLSRLGL